MRISGLNSLKVLLSNFDKEYEDKSTIQSQLKSVLNMVFFFAFNKCIPLQYSI